ncbi:MAG: heavy metal translocating P-type ATPase, partial [Lentisphaerae bacterium]|nr:heavy metal translocating P-type ATPase [Lentisphaerota bacterium]
LALLPPLIMGGGWGRWLYEALVLLVIACPCALVISTPVSIVAALSAAASAGVLVKGGVFLETAARIRVVALDKTGTLTHGHPAVQRIIPLHGSSEDEVLEVAAALEQHSGHPLARAILQAAAQRGRHPPAAESFTLVQGLGAEGRVRGRPCWVGSHRMLHERGLERAAVHRQLEAFEDAGHSVVVVGNETQVCGLIAVADTIRPGAAAVVQELRAAGIGRIALLTGDNRGTAQAVAQAVGIEDVRAELLPADKLRAVEELVRTAGPTAMIGDGINDAPALAAATLGIAMGTAGSEAAIETADIALMADDLSRVPWLMRHARRTLRIIRQNIVFALAVKAVFLILTLLDHGTLWMAIAADMGASLLVIFNALRLLRRGG